MKRPTRPSEGRRPLAVIALIAVTACLAEAAFSQPEAPTAPNPAPGRETPPPARGQRTAPSATEEAPALTAEDAHAPAPNAAPDPLRRARDALLAAGDPAAARSPAEQLVGRADAASDPRYPSDLVRLGMIHTLLGEFDAAERRYFEAIDAIRSAKGEFSLALAEPYRALGRSYLLERRFVEAITALQQAQHVSQRNLGLFNIEQAELIDDLTTAYLGLGDVETAIRLQRERLDNAVRRFGENDPRVVPYRYELARYYDRSRLRAAARKQYEKALAALEPLGNEAALLEPLRRLLRIELLLRDRDDARARIAAILERSPDVAAVELARSLTALGDFALARDEDPTTAAALYAEAYALLEAAPEERARLLGQPEMLDFVAPLTRVDLGTSARPYAWGTIVVTFDVTADGRARNVSVVSAEPSGMVDEAYVRRIREAHFRPRIAGGAPAETDGLRYMHSFRYYVERD